MNLDLFLPLNVYQENAVLSISRKSISKHIAGPFKNHRLFTGREFHARNVSELTFFVRQIVECLRIDVEGCGPEYNFSFMRGEVFHLSCLGAEKINIATCP